MSTICQIGLSSVSSLVVKPNQDCKFEPMMGGTSLMHWDEYVYRLYAVEERSLEQSEDIDELKILHLHLPVMYSSQSSCVILLISYSNGDGFTSRLSTRYLSPVDVRILHVKISGELTPSSTSDLQGGCDCYCVSTWACGDWVLEPDAARFHPRLHLAAALCLRLQFVNKLSYSFSDSIVPFKMESLQSQRNSLQDPAVIGHLSSYSRNSVVGEKEWARRVSKEELYSELLMISKLFSPFLWLPDSVLDTLQSGHLEDEQRHCLLGMVVEKRILGLHRMKRLTQRLCSWMLSVGLKRPANDAFVLHMTAIDQEHRPTGYKFAIKILSRRKMKSHNMEEKVRREIKICRLFVHPHIIRLYEVIETLTDIYVVMEYAKSRELFDYIVEKRRFRGMKLGAFSNRTYVPDISQEDKVIWICQFSAKSAWESNNLAKSPSTVGEEVECACHHRNGKNLTHAIYKPSLAAAVYQLWGSVSNFYLHASNEWFSRTDDLFIHGNHFHEDTGPVSCIAWTPDNSAFTVGWKLWGLASEDTDELKILHLHLPVMYSSQSSCVILLISYSNGDGFTSRLSTRYLSPVDVRILHVKISGELTPSSTSDLQGGCDCYCASTSACGDWVLEPDAARFHPRLHLAAALCLRLQFVNKLSYSFSDSIVPFKMESLQSQRNSLQDPAVIGHLSSYSRNSVVGEKEWARRVSKEELYSELLMISKLFSPFLWLPDSVLDTLQSGHLEDEQRHCLLGMVVEKRILGLHRMKRLTQRLCSWMLSVGLKRPANDAFVLHMTAIDQEHRPTGYKFAIKILSRRKMKSHNMEEKVRREIKICRLFVHPHIIRLYEVIETLTDIYVVMEYAKSRELFDYIVEKRRFRGMKLGAFSNRQDFGAWAPGVCLSSDEAVSTLLSDQ
ncbi:hypothetical protein RHSIM_Rhsim12G0103300 [Rhododendron simsii]|uniref:Protein kinase domain-containing protein n=1 Tax=Rhododendron simsii TaxID=118357 RepID=A0A834L809_RHOSS|nr:hypothetical protein RHSIM_Rhsim12G0103300 [Rhododendron simsii]